MHELAVCQALMEQVESIAHREHADYVVTIHLGIGSLSGIEPRLLEQAFYIARAGSVANNADLVIESMPVKVSCKQCGLLTEVLPSRLVCGSCGDWRTSLVSGDELELRHVELVRQEPVETEPESRVEHQQFN